MMIKFNKNGKFSLFASFLLLICSSIWYWLAEVEIAIFIIVIAVMWFVVACGEQIQQKQK